MLFWNSWLELVYHLAINHSVSSHLRSMQKAIPYHVAIVLKNLEVSLPHLAASSQPISHSSTQGSRFGLSTMDMHYK